MICLTGTKRAIYKADILQTFKCLGVSIKSAFYAVYF